MRSEEFELLLHVALYLIYDDGILVGPTKNTSAKAVDVTRSHVSVTRITLGSCPEVRTLRHCRAR